MEHPYFSTRVSNLQIGKIADFMEKHPELVNVKRRGLDFTPSQEEELWEELAGSLNAEIFNGGSFQPTEKWKAWWKKYSFRLNKRYLNNLRKLSQTRILTTSDARLLKVMGRDHVQKIWNAEQNLLSSTSADQNVPGLKAKGDFGIKIKSCFTLKKSESKPKTTLIPFSGAITTAQRKSASYSILKTREKCQTTQTCDPFSNAIANAQRKSASSTIVKTSKKSQSTQTCDSFSDAIATAQQKSASCTIKTSEKSQATQTCDLFFDVIATAQQKSASSTVLKKSKKSQVKLRCDPFRDAIAQQKPASYSILKTSKNSQAKQTCDPNKKNVDSIALQKSAADINPTPLNSPTLPGRSANSLTDNTLGEQNGTFTRNGTTADALLAIANEINIESTLAQQKMELKQERLRLHKRKVAAVQLISKKMCLF